MGRLCCGAAEGDGMSAALFALWLLTCLSAFAVYDLPTGHLARRLER
jgi:hypothetical protein